MKLVTRSLLALVFTIIASTAIGQSKIGSPRLMQGPMVGAVTTDSALIWGRVNESWEVQVTYDSVYPFENPQTTEPVRAAEEDDRIVKIELTGLTADTKYYYRVLVNGAPERLTRDLPAASFKTAPGAPARFRVAIGSCIEFMRYREQPIWKAIYRAQPDFFVWMGDNIYGDTQLPETLREEYLRQREVPTLQPVLHTVPQLAVWDDHDFGLNNHNQTNPIREEALEVFKQVWANPSYGLPETPGVFFKYTYGGVDFFMLDSRYYADPQNLPDSPERSFLGEAQVAWLKEGLLASEAPFKVLIMGPGWSIAKGEGQDSYGGRLYERNALFDFIRDEEISGVVLVSGDTHVGELNCIPWSERGGYDLYEFVSSPLSAPFYMRYAEDEAEIRIRDVYTQANFGVLDFNLTGEVPELRFSLMTEQGRYAWYPQEFTVTADELVNGESSWREKIDPDRLEKMDLSRPILDRLPDYLNKP